MENYCDLCGKFTIINIEHFCKDCEIKLKEYSTPDDFPNNNLISGSGQFSIQ